MKLKEIVGIIEAFAPLAGQAEYDNSGLLYGDPEGEIKGILITLDTNPEVVSEAIARGCNLIVEHHPTVFTPLRSIDLSLPTHRALCTAIANEIAVYSAHTSVDFAPGGLNDALAARLGLTEIAPIDPSDPASGRIGTVSETTMQAFARHVADVLGDRHVASVGDPCRPVRRVALINGGGGGDVGALFAARKAGADIFVTSELKYHIVRLAKDSDYGIICFGHYDSEIGFVDLMADVLTRNGVSVPILKSERCLNPYND